MLRKILALGAIVLLSVSGCGEKKADPAKVGEAIRLIDNKEFEKGIALLDDLARSSPSDETLKKTQAQGHVKYGNYFMYESTLPPKEKYPSALRQYRTAAALDPANEEAKQNIGLIEGTYNQTGRTIPN